MCPHAGGVGLRDYARHLSMVDYLAISRTTQDRVAEYADHLHEHSVDPCIVRGGAYVAPEAPGGSITPAGRLPRRVDYPGWSITMKPGSLETYRQG